MLKARKLMVLLMICLMGAISGCETGAHGDQTFSIGYSQTVEFRTHTAKTSGEDSKSWIKSPLAEKLLTGIVVDEDEDEDESSSPDGK